MTADDLVAVVVPLFNAERTIAATLDSILAQTHRALEVIVVDDGSSDRSMAIVQAVQRRDPRIRSLSQCNAGAAAARNAGAAVAHAPYLAFCDADDLWAPRKIELQVARMREGGEAMAMVYCWFARIDADDNVLAVNRSGVEGDIFATLLRRNVIGNGSSALFRKAAFDALGGFAAHLTHAEDLAIHLAAAERYRIGVVPQILVGYRMSARSLSSHEKAVYVCTSAVMAPYSSRYPRMRTTIVLHLRGVLMWQIIMAVRRLRIRTAIWLTRQDCRVVWTIARVYIPELLADIWRGRVKDSWTGLFRRGACRPFAALATLQDQGGSTSADPWPIAPLRLQRRRPRPDPLAPL